MSDVNINQRWTKTEDMILIQNYTIKNIEELQTLLPNRSKKAIFSRASSLGLKHYTYDKNYFGKINTHNKAYWVGFLSADGYITTKYRWGVELKIDDITHLEKLNNELKSNITIRTRVKKCFVKDKDYYGETCSLTFKNKQMYSDLALLGFTHNKSNEIRFPFNNIPKNLRIDYIVGLIDGDGSYVKSINGKYFKYAINLVSNSEMFLKDIQNILKEELNIQTTIRLNNGTYVLTIGRKQDIYKFCKIAIKNNMMLERKRQKVQQFIEELEVKNQ